MVSLSPIRILKREAGEEKFELARVSNFVGAFAIGDLVKSTLGPKGMDKILVSKGKNPGQVEITNDGATILKSIGIVNPAAKILVEMAVAEDDEVGDGTTSVTVLASELLKEAEQLIDQKIHPQTIVRGWQIAVKIAEEALASVAIDQSSNVALFRENLIKVASTTLSSKILFQHRDHFSKLAVDAVLRLKDSSRNINAIQIIKIKGGVLEDSFLEEGLLLNKNTDWSQTQKIENANILIANTAMDADKIKVFGTKVKVDSTAKLAELESAEKEKMSDKVAKILAHNINVFVNRQLIYDYPKQLFADAGVITIEHVDFDELERLALVTGGEILSTFDHPELVKLGQCDLIEPIMIGENTLLRFGGVPFRGACTIVIRGATKQIIDEAERSLHDALCVLMAILDEPLMIYGGGASEVTMANAIYIEAAHQTGKESLAMESFARALLNLPKTIADNGGYDSAQLINELKAAHSQGSKSFGLDMQKGEIGCMKKLGVLESFTVKRQILLSASEAAEIILRVDNIIRTAPTDPKDRETS